MTEELEVRAGQLLLVLVVVGVGPRPRELQRGLHKKAEFRMREGARNTASAERLRSGAHGALSSGTRASMA